MKAAYVPNHIPIWKRLIAFAAIILSAIVLYQYVATNATTLSVGRRGPSLVVSGVWGLPAVAMFGGMLSASTALIVDHYDKRPNERFYNLWITWSIVSMFVGKISAMAVIHYLKNA